MKNLQTKFYKNMNPAPPINALQNDIIKIMTCYNAGSVKNSFIILVWRFPHARSSYVSNTKAKTSNVQNVLQSHQYCWRKSKQVSKE